MSQSDRHAAAAPAELDVVAVLDIVFKNIWRILAVTLFAALIGTAWAFIWYPKYQADLMIQIENSVDGGLASSSLGSLSSLFDVKSSAAAEAQIITSRMVLSRAVEKQRLYIDVDPVRVPLIGDFVKRTYSGHLNPGLFGIGNFAWGTEHADVTRFDVPKILQDERFRLRVETGGGYTLSSSYLDTPAHGIVGVEQTIKTSYGPVVLNVERFDAAPGVSFELVRHSLDDTVNELQQRLDVQEKVKQSGVIIATLLGRDADRTKSILLEIGEQYVRQNVERKYADAAQSLAFLNSQLPQLRQTLMNSQARYTEFRNTHSAIDLPSETTIGMQRQAEAKTQLVLLQQKRAELVAHYTPNHPQVLAVDEQIKQLRGNISTFDTDLHRLPNVEQDMARLMLDLKVDTDLYTTTLNNVQQLQLVKAGRLGSVRLIDTPVMLDTPAWPKRPLVIVAALMAGLLLGLTYAFVREYLYGSLNSAHDVEHGTGLSVLASIPLSAAQRPIGQRAIEKTAGQINLLAAGAPHDLAIESLRSLRTSLRMTMPNESHKVVLVTGAAPGAGKSFVTANLGAVLASMGQRVLIIDSDLRRASLHPMFGMSRRSGWSDIIAQTLPMDSAIHHIESPRLDFIPAGTMVPNPAEFLSSPRVAEYLNTLRASYDYVLIDTPPILAVEDAAALAVHAHAVLLVARAGATRIGELRESIKRLERSGVRPAGVVLNGLSARSTRMAYGGYHYASYDYGVLADDRLTLLQRLRSWIGRK